MGTWSSKEMPTMDWLRRIELAAEDRRRSEVLLLHEISGKANETAGSLSSVDI
jgi:hypothetical protein